MSANDEMMVPRLAQGVRLKFDAARDSWIVLAPERIIVPEETALEVLRKCDGERSLAAIIDELVAEYDAPRDVIAEDVHSLILELTAKGLLRS